MGGAIVMRRAGTAVSRRGAAGTRAGTEHAADPKSKGSRGSRVPGPSEAGLAAMSTSMSTGPGVCPIGEKRLARRASASLALTGKCS